jgi:uncharacterized protein YacL (UPF0231 family)
MCMRICYLVLVLNRLWLAFVFIKLEWMNGAFCYLHIELEWEHWIEFRFFRHLLGCIRVCTVMPSNVSKSWTTSKISEYWTRMRALDTEFTFFRHLLGCIRVCTVMPSNVSKSWTISKISANTGRRGSWPRQLSASTRIVVTPALCVYTTMASGDCGLNFGELCKKSLNFYCHTHNLCDSKSLLQTTSRNSISRNRI